jgi:hypothetical protein
MANLTLVVDDAVLKRARQRAIEEGTSVNAQVRGFLQRYAGNGAGFEGFLALTEGLGARSGPEGRTWRRSELHERGSEGPKDGPARARTDTSRRSAPHATS